MEPLILKNNQYSVLVVESLSGILLKTDFERYTWEGKTHHIFNNENLALKFINDMLVKVEGYDFSMYNSKGEYLYTINKDT